MEPLITNGQIVYLNKLRYLFSRPKVGDVVALKDPRDAKILVKRVTRVHKNLFFVQGDNSMHSTDSRVFGMIQKKDILGKIIL